MAGLDFLTVFRNLLYVTLTINLGFEGLSNLGVFNTITRNLFILSLLFSAYYTFKQKKIGFWIYVVQIPFRIYFFTFSFSVLSDLPIKCVFENGGLILLILIPALELFRIWYWVKNYHNSFPKKTPHAQSENLLDD
jgi:hypothetical protein